MRITSIEKARKGGKFSVHLDGEIEILLSKEIIVDFGLRRNDEIPDDLLENIRDAQCYHDVYIAAGRLLNYRMRTHSELDQRLRKKGFPQEVVKRVIVKLSTLGLLDDSRFADAYVSTKLASRPVGRRELERGLREKGVEKEVAERALLEIRGDEVQLKLAIDAAETKLKSLRRFQADKRRDKLVSFLARRGFDWEIIRRVTRTLFKGDHDAIDI